MAPAFKATPRPDPPDESPRGAGTKPAIGRSGRHPYGTRSKDVGPGARLRMGAPRPADGGTRPMTRGKYEPTCPGDDACLWGNCEVHGARYPYSIHDVTVVDPKESRRLLEEAWG